MDNILEIIGVKDQFKIPKPGTNKELGEAVAENLMNNIYGLSKHILKNKMRSRRKGNAGAFKIRDRRYFSKGNLQARNQGH